MNIFAFLLVGLVAGFLAGKTLERHGFGIARDMVIGTIGSFLGGIFFTSTEYHAAIFWEAILMATLGAVVLLVIVNLIQITLAPHKRLTHL